MAHYALVKGGKVENVTEWDGDEWMPPAGYEVIDLTGHPNVGPGWTYADGVFTAPPVVPFVHPQITSAGMADGLARLLDEFVAAGALTTAKADAIKTQLNGWKQ